MKTILFVGPLPPPVHGFAAINLAMLNQLKSDSTSNVIEYNRTPSGYFGKNLFIFFVIRNIVLWFDFLSASLFKKNCVLYLALSGGNGKLYDLPYVLIAKIFSIKTYIHHHSYAHLIKRNFITKFFFFFVKSATHIALCEKMKSSILEVVLVPDDKVLVVSNAAFMEDIVLFDRAELSSVLNIGFLSNITKEKGIFEFIELVKYLVLNGVDVKALVAGPVEAKILDEFNNAIGTLPQIEYVGPVYGEKKDDFFKKIDILIFPTKNDAEPVTILEALGYGCIVIASNQGCISNQLCEDSGIIINEYEKFTEHAYCFLEKIIRDKVLFEQKSAAALRQFHKLRSVNRERLNRLSKKLMCG